MFSKEIKGMRGKRFLLRMFERDTKRLNDGTIEVIQQEVRRVLCEAYWAQRTGLLRTVHGYSRTHVAFKYRLLTTDDALTLEVFVIGSGAWQNRSSSRQAMATARTLPQEAK